MKTKITRLLLSAVLMMCCTVMANASHPDATKIDNIYYILDDATLTAAVTWGGDNYWSGTNEYFGNIDIPFAITNSGKTYKVTSVGKNAFENCNMLQSVTIPSGVTSIENCAFFQCGMLKSITIPSGVTSIGVSAFYNCDNLSLFTFLAFNAPTILDKTAFLSNIQKKFYVPSMQNYDKWKESANNINIEELSQYSYAQYILDEINAVWNRESLTAQDNEIIESYITEIEGSESNAQIYADEQTIFEIIRLRPLKNEAIATINALMEGAPSSAYLNGLVHEHIDMINAVTDENTFTSKKNEIISGLPFAIPAYQAGVTETLESLSHSEGTGNGVRITKDSQTIELMNPDKVEYFIRK